MILAELQSPTVAAAKAKDARALMERLYPLCRSITGPGVRQTLDAIEQRIPLQRQEIESGSELFDWEVPNEWTIRNAFIEDAAGTRIVDFRASNLHVVSYSTPVQGTLTLDQLQPHLHSLPDQPDLIPYRTTYWKNDWGFCLRHRDRERLGPGPYRVVIDSTLEPGSLSLAELTIRGSSDGEAIIYTHTCHPSLANDNLSGIAVATSLARAMMDEKPRLTWRFVFGPGTLGSLAWLSINEPVLERVRAGLTLGLLGDTRPLTYKRSRRGDTLVDRVAEYALTHLFDSPRIVGFEPYGYDERQFCSPGFDLPVGRLSRAQHGEYPEYHTSGDNLSLVADDRIAESIAACARICSIIDSNRRLMNRSPKGEPRLGKRGLFSLVGGKTPAQFEQALLWVLNLSDGRHDLVDVAQRSGLPYDLIDSAATALSDVNLLAPLPDGPLAVARGANA